MTRHHSDTQFPIRLSNDTEVRTNIGVIIAIAGAVFVAGGLWARIEFKLAQHEDSISAMSTVQKVDHDILIRLDRRTEWLGRSQPTAATVKPTFGVE